MSRITNFGRGESLVKGEIYIFLSQPDPGWPEYVLVWQIKQYAPHLFEKEKSVQSADEEF